MSVKTTDTILLEWAELDLNQRRRKPADLQSAPFNPSGTDPKIFQNSISILKQYHIVKEKTIK